MRGAAPRGARIRYGGVTREGESVDRTVEGLHARVVKHECDHLDGILYPQRMSDLSLLVFNEESARFPIDLDAAGEEGAWTRAPRATPCFWRCCATYRSTAGAAACSRPPPGGPAPPRPPWPRPFPPAPPPP